MAIKEKKFILEFDTPTENGSYRVAIAQHPQKNKFPHLYSVYIWKWNGLKEDWVKEYYYDREQRCFFRPYKMQYLESVGKTARYIRDKLIPFFAQQPETSTPKTTPEAPVTDEPIPETVKFNAEKGYYYVSCPHLRRLPDNVDIRHITNDRKEKYANEMLETLKKFHQALLFIKTHDKTGLKNEIDYYLECSLDTASKYCLVWLVNLLRGKPVYFREREIYKFTKYELEKNILRFYKRTISATASSQSEASAPETTPATEQQKQPEALVSASNPETIPGDNYSVVYRDSSEKYHLIMQCETHSICDDSNDQPEASASTPAPVEVNPETQEHSTSTIDTSSLQKLVTMTRKEVQQGYIPFSSRALWYNEIQKYHPEMKCWDSEPIARKAACGDFSALPEDMLLIVQELSEPETTAHVEPKTAVVDIQSKSQTTQPSEPKPSAPVQEVKPKRKLPTPKNPRGFVCNFSECKDPEKLRETLNGGSLNVVKSIAESFNEFQPRKYGKTMTKKDYVTAIVMLYFPDYQPKKPAQEVKRDCMGREIIQCGSKFIPGKFYVAGSANYRNEPNPTPEFIKVIKRKNDTITVQVVSYPDFQPIFKPVSKKVKQFHYYHKGKTLALYESITLPNSHDYEGKDMWIASLCEYNAMFITTPGYDIDFDETAYSPNVQDVSVIVDDIPADHEPDMQEVKPEAPAPSEPERQQGKLCPLLSLSYWDRHTKYHNEKCRKNRKIIDTLQTIEEITAIMLDFGMNNIFEQAIYDRVHLSGQYPRETDEETTARYAETYAQKIIVRRQRKAKAEARKNAPKPATRKLHHAVKTDCNRQIVIQFDELENTPAPTSEPAKPKAKRKPRMPRVKRDYSRQVLIDFGKNIPDSQTNQRQAA